MKVSIQAIKELRERTQAGMGDCKKALQEADGDMDKAVEVILKKGKAKSAKRAGKVAAEGEVRAELWSDNRNAAIIEVNIETDFSARNDKFKSFVDTVALAVREADTGADLAALAVDGKSLAQHAEDITAVIGEKITLRRFAKLGIGEGKHGFCHSYIHMGGKIGVIVAVEGETAEAAASDAAHDLAETVVMQVAAMNPQALRRDEIPEAEVAKQKEIFEAQLRDDPKPKPEKVWPKIIEGKVNAWFRDVVLLEQQSPNPDHEKKTIEQLRVDAGKAAGGGLAITNYVRFELGEGIEKKQEDLAAGVAELLG